jgi:hypothetical protein
MWTSHFDHVLVHHKILIPIISWTLISSGITSHEHQSHCDYFCHEYQSSHEHWSRHWYFSWTPVLLVITSHEHQPHYDYFCHEYQSYQGLHVLTLWTIILSVISSHKRRSYRGLLFLNTDPISYYFAMDTNPISDYGTSHELWSL